MDKVLIDIRNEDDAIINQFDGADTITIDDLLNKIVDLSWEIEHLNEEIEDMKENHTYDEYDDFDDRWHSGEFI